MEVTTISNGYTYYYYHLADGEAYTDEMPEIVDWVRSGGEMESGGEQHEIDETTGKDYIYHNSVHERGFVHSANIGTVITVCNIIINIALIVLVLLRRSTRLQFVYQQVVNLALSDLAFSVMVDPFTIYFELHPWRLGKGFCVTWMLLDAALPFVSFLVLIALNVDRLLFAVSPPLYHRTFRRVPLRIVVFMLPWLLGLGVVLPLWLSTAVAWPQHGICLYGVTKQAAVVSAVVSLYLPCVVLIVLTVLVLISIIGSMPQDVTELSALRNPANGPATRSTHVTVVRQTFQSSPASSLLRTGYQDNAGGRDGEGGERLAVKKGHRLVVVALCVINLLTVITQLPYGAISMLEPECVEPECNSTIKLIQALGWMRSVTFALHPFCLLTMTQVRHTFCVLCGCRASDPDSEQSQARSAVTPSANTKSDQMELTSVNTAIVQPPEKGPSTML